MKCTRRDLNSQGQSPLPPQDSVFTNFTTSAKKKPLKKACKRKMGDSNSHTEVNLRRISNPLQYHYGNLPKKRAEDEGLEPPSLAAAVFKTADLPISLIFRTNLRGGKYMTTVWVLSTYKNYFFTLCRYSFLPSKQMKNSLTFQLVHQRLRV